MNICSPPAFVISTILIRSNSSNLAFSRYAKRHNPFPSTRSMGWRGKSLALDKLQKELIEFLGVRALRVHKRELRSKVKR